MLLDLKAWYPKVRLGGLVSGDDYGDCEATEWLTSERFARGIAKGPRPLDTASAYHWGTVRAVNAFARSRGHQLFVTYLHDCYLYPAWYFVKA